MDLSNSFSMYFHLVFLLFHVLGIIGTLLYVVFIFSKSGQILEDYSKIFLSFVLISKVFLPSDVTWRL